jgi:putative restriction endonuclease
LCLNSIHDRAFDCGLLTVAPEFKVKVSPRISRKSADTAAQEFLRRYDNASVSVPHRFAPDAEFLRYHNHKIFLG